MSLQTENHLDDVMEFSDDVKVQELQSCHFIFPDLTIDLIGLSGSLPVHIKIEDGLHLSLTTNDGIVQETTTVNHLPPITLHVQLPTSYPESDPPMVDINSTVLSELQISHLKSELIDIWQTMHDQVLYSMIDHIQNGINDMIGHDYKVKNAEVYLGLIEFDRKTKKDEFNERTFTCEICQDDYKGIKCSRIEKCGHVFCNTCLYECFSNYITRGEVEKVHCPEFNCTKEYAKFKGKATAIDNSTMKASDIMNLVENLLKPPLSLNFLSEILNRGRDTDPNEEDLVKRYYRLFQRQQYELVGTIFPRRVIECPKKGCGEKLFRLNISDNLMICHNCKHVFCATCLNSFHGDYKLCATRNGDWYGGILLEDLKKYMELEEGDVQRENIVSQYGHKRISKAAKEYDLDLLFDQFKQESGAMDCPMCKTVVERIDGCNKMMCVKCGSHFCYLCGQHIKDYDHFNNQSSKCYGLLFLGSPGHENDQNFGLGFA